MSHPHNAHGSTVLAFWIYLLGDAILFAALFAAYLVLYSSTFGGPTISQVANAPHALIATLLLLTSSYACTPAHLAALSGQRVPLIAWSALAGALGIAFLSLQLAEFLHLIDLGITWQVSAAMSAFFTLVGTHALHIFGALLWLTVLLAQMVREGPSERVIRRFTCFRLFWHFSAIVWVAMFTLVYLMGAPAYVY